MIKKIISNRLKIDENGYAYIEGQNGEKHYSFDWNGSPNKTKVKFKLDKTYISICLFLIGIWVFIIYLLIK